MRNYRKKQIKTLNLFKKRERKAKKRKIVGAIHLLLYKLRELKDFGSYGKKHISSVMGALLTLGLKYGKLVKARSR